MGTKRRRSKKRQNPFGDLNEGETQHKMKEFAEKEPMEVKLIESKTKELKKLVHTETKSNKDDSE